MSRSFESDIIPMARTFGQSILTAIDLMRLFNSRRYRVAHIGLALAPWDVLAGGRLRSDAEEQRRRETGEKGRTVWGPQWERTEDEKKMSNALETVALEVAGEEEPPSVQAGECDSFSSFGNTVHLSVCSTMRVAVAIAYILHKYPYVVPIVGGRKVEQLEANVKALEISLSEDQIAYLESVFPFDPGFPHKMIVCGFVLLLFCDLHIGTLRFPGRWDGTFAYNSHRWVFRETGGSETGQGFQVDGVDGKAEGREGRVVNGER